MKVKIPRAPRSAPRPALVLLSLLAGCAAPAVRTTPGHFITVAAGAFDRQNTPVQLALPAGARGAAGLELVDELGRVTPLQHVGTDSGSFILDQLAAGSTRRFRLREATHRPAGVRALRERGAVRFEAAGGPVLRYNAERTPLPRPGIDPVFQRGGYIHPVHTPSGRVITSDYPADHLHHHGIWAAWTNTEFEGRTPDFWNMGERKGTVEPVAVDSVWEGPAHGGLIARHRYVDLTASTPRPVLDERWTVRVYAVPGGARPYRIFDLEVIQTTATSSPLRLPEYRYGGVGFRGRDEWLGAEHTFFLTSEGKDRSNGHATRARWTHVGGRVDGQLAGIGILAHPSNFRFPEPVRIHPTEPFFNWAPSQAGAWAIEPGRPYVARYRFVSYDGAPDAAELNRLWNDFAHPPQVTLSTR